MNAFEAAENNRRSGELQKEQETLISSQNKSPNKDATSIPWQHSCALQLRSTSGHCSSKGHMRPIFL